MRLPIAAAALCVPGVAAAQAVPLPGLQNTGFGTYTLTGPAQPELVVTPHPFWVSAPAGSDWIGPSDGSQDDPLGTYTYTYTLDLTGYFPHTVVLTGNMSSDNSGGIWVNGVDSGFSNFPTDWSGLVSFMLERDFVEGINTIQFIVENTGTSGNNPTGLLVADFAGTAVPLGSPVLSVSPLMEGVLGTGTVDYATPGGSVGYTWSPNTGSTTIPGGYPCAGLQLDLAPPFGGPVFATADALGTAVATGTPPNAGPTLHFQAVDIATCAKTNTVAQTIQ